MADRGGPYRGITRDSTGQSNPNLDSAGINDFPALVRVRLDGDSIDVTPVLNGNAQAIDIPTEGNLDLSPPSAGWCSDFAI